MLKIFLRIDVNAVGTIEYGEFLMLMTHKVLKIIQRAAKGKPKESQRTAKGKLKEIQRKAKGKPEESQREAKGTPKES